MKRIDDRIRLSATDLAGHLACRHLTSLSLEVAEGRLREPHTRRAELETLHELGQRHERGYLEHLAGRGRSIVTLEDPGDVALATSRTLAAMRSGAEVIYQATLTSGRWLGRADFLQRVERPSQLGGWSYEVYDTKLAQETRGGTILQLCLYTEIIGELQGLAPEFMHVVSPGPRFDPQTYRVDDFVAYYRLVKRRLEERVDDRLVSRTKAEAPIARADSAALAAVPVGEQISLDFAAATDPNADPPSIQPRGRRDAPTPGVAVASAGESSPALATYPEPVEHCDVCRWWPICTRRRRDDDHLSLVAGISRLHTRELERHGIVSLASLARHPLPLRWKPTRGSRETYERVREQARVQSEGRDQGRPVYELLPIEPGQGLARLPWPSPGDLFLDLEGDPYVGEGGLEFLFGTIVRDEQGELQYQARWATSRAEERVAFEALVDAIMERWSQDPDLHVYHFAPYEPATLKRLMGRYASRESEIDALLRGERFVDLYQVVRRALRASVERYSIKDLEVFFGFRRAQPLEDAGAAMRIAQRALELRQLDVLTTEVRNVVEAYNRDDCMATLALRDWLERLRLDCEADGLAVPRHEPKPAEASEPLKEREARVAELMERLTTDVPLERAERDDEQHARWLLAHMLDWHRREKKVSWWEYFRMRDLPEEDLLDEKAAIAGLAFIDRVGGTERCPIHRYAFPPQDLTIRGGSEVHSGEEKIGSVDAIDVATRTIDLKKTEKAAGHHPTSLFAHSDYPTQTMADSLVRLGAWVADHGLDAPGPVRAGRNLLLRRRPRFVPRAGAEPAAFTAPADGPAAAHSLRRAGETVLQAARRLALELDHGVLAVQGPPGAGKTYTGARMIVALVQAGKRVGVSAVPHRVIRNLLEEVVRAAAEEGVDIRCVHKLSESIDDDHPQIIETTKNEDVMERLRSGEVQVAGSTQWLWSREEFREAVDVLIVDEAGQMCLADVLAIAPAASSLVLIGDPQQLEQPQQGSHPEGTNVSALEHILADRKTVADDRGLFLGETWRLHPDICRFTSDLFYEGRLAPRAHLDRQQLIGAAPYDGAGLWFVPVEHEGNTSASPEEVDAVAALVERLSRDGVRWVNGAGEVLALGLDDILIVAPYNAQVADLRARLPAARVGTVDRFQGQEAAVVIYSMTTSRPEDAPRGMEFLYSPNRLNVATSRARCACMLVGNARLFEPECQTPHHMRLANAFCGFLERSRERRLVDSVPP